MTISNLIRSQMETTCAILILKRKRGDLLGINEEPTSSYFGKSPHLQLREETDDGSGNADTD